MLKKIQLILFLILLSLGSNSQVPYGLNSNPSSTGTIYLDFDGHWISDYFWVAYNRDTPFYAQPSVLTREQMIKVFNHVSEDFSPFEVNVTTDSSVYLSAPNNTRIRVVVTPTSSWYGSAGGVAYLESYSWADPNIIGDIGNDVPCFAFDAALLKNEKRVAEVCSHEVGHSLGLDHQSTYAYEGTDSCRFAWEYNSGKFGIFPAEDLSWAPIMGVGYSRNLTIWHNGKRSLGTCGTIQNDISVILRPANKIVLKNDDYTNIKDLSKNVNFIDTSYNIDGLITDSLDFDFFKFNFNKTGRFKAKVRPFVDGPEIIAAFPMRRITNWNGNVDLEMTLYKNNTIIGVYNDTAKLNASIDTTLDPGIYYIKVNSVKNVNAGVYGMIGTYNLSGSFIDDVSLPIRNIELSCNSKSNIIILTWNVVSDEEIQSIEIQVSRDNIVWDRLTNVDVTTNNYSYKSSDNKTLYFRLFVKSVIGETKYSNVCVISKSNNKRSILVSQNQILINSDNTSDWRIIDMYGRTLSIGKLRVGSNLIDLSNLENGIYTIQVLGGNNSYNQRFTIQK